MGTTRKKGYLDRSCYDMAVERCERLFDEFDKVVVMFSGGKDSTACVNIAAEAARRKGRLPLDVCTFDEEAISPETVEYMARVAAREDLRFRWYCIPVELRNACSRKQPNWYCWAPEDREIWTRELPEQAITEPEWAFKREPIPQATLKVFGPEYGRVAQIMGIRCDESMTRFRAIASKSCRSEDAWLSPVDGAAHVTKAYPIYDWAASDVWLAPHAFGWDYNRAYDVMAAAGIPFTQSRISPAFGEQPLRHLWKFHLCWPELWAKMVDRVPGAATAARYSNTELYGVNCNKAGTFEGKTWQEMCYESMLSIPDPKARAEVARMIRVAINDHATYAPGEPVPDGEPHPVSGYCWRDMFPSVQTGGDKLNRQSQKLSKKARDARIRMGVTQADRKMKKFK